MDAESLQDRIDQGMGTAARAIGALCNAFRPKSATTPLVSGNRFLQLSVAFNAQDPRFQKAGLPAQAIWYAVCDSSYLLPGDYLVEIPAGRTWFVTALQSLLPTLCILTNRTLTVTRPNAYAVTGLNAYGGGGTLAPVVSGFPASLLHGGDLRGAEAIPADARIAGAVALLPAVAGLSFARGDIVTDDLGRSYVTAQAEQNELGWRLDVRQAAS